MTSSPPPGQLGPHPADRRAGGGGAVQLGGARQRGPRKWERPQEGTRGGPLPPPTPLFQREPAVAGRTRMEGRQRRGGDGQGRGAEWSRGRLAAAGQPPPGASRAGRRNTNKAGGCRPRPDAARPLAGKCPPGPMCWKRRETQGPATQEPDAAPPAWPPDPPPRSTLMASAGTSPARRRRSPSAPPQGPCDPPARNQKLTLDPITPG